MDLISVLEKSISTDIIEAENSQAVIDDVADFNLEEFLISLAKILNDTEKSVGIRKNAVYQIKKALRTGDEWETRLDYQSRWFALCPSVRRLLKDTVLSCLGTEEITPSPAADLLAFIAGAELPNDQWPDLISDLSRNVTNVGNTDNVKEASLVAIARLCRQNYECERCKMAIGNSSEVFKSIFHGLLYVTNSDVMTAAVNAMREWINLKKDKSRSNPQINSAIHRISEMAVSPDNRIKAAALKCLRKFQISYLEKKLSSIMIEAVESEIPEIRRQGFKFWYEQCFEDSPKIKSKTGFTSCNAFNRETLPSLLAIFLKALTLYGHNDQDGNKLWILANDSMRVLSEWCDVSTLRQYLTCFIHENIRNVDWKYRCSAVRAYYSLLWIDWNQAKPLIQKAIPVFLEILEKDENESVKYTTAVVIGEICSMIQDSNMFMEHLNSLIEGLLKSLKDAPRVVCGVCEAIEDVAYKAYSFSQTKETFCLSQYFEFIVYSLMETLYRRDGTESSRGSIYNAMKCLLQYSTKDCTSVFCKLGMVFAQRLQHLQTQMPEQNGDTQQCNANGTESLSLLRTLQILIRSMDPDHLEKSYGKILSGLMHILKKQRCPLIIRAVTLETISLIVKGLGEKFLPHMESLLPVLIVDLKNRKREQTCIAAVQLLHAICNAVEENFLPYCDSIVSILLESLSNENTNRRIKDSVLLTIGDLAKATGSNFKKYLNVILTTLVLLQSQVDKEYMSDNRICALYTHHCNFLKAYTGIVQGMKSDQNAVDYISTFLEPQLKSMLDVINAMALNKSDYDYKDMDDFYLTQGMSMLKNIYSVFGKSIQHLIVTPNIMDILNIGCTSEKDETKALANAIKNQLKESNMLPILT